MRPTVLQNPSQAAAWVLVHLAQYQIYIYRSGRNIVPQCSQETFDRVKGKNFDDVFEYGRPMLMHVFAGAHWRVLAGDPKLNQLVQGRLPYLRSFILDPTATHIAYLEERGNLEEQEEYDRQMWMAQPPRSPAAGPIGSRQPTLPREEPVGSVYFVRSGLHGPVKIGFTTNNIRSRISEMQTGSAEELLLLAAMDGTMSDEQSLHRRFAAIRIRGEWFQAAPELLAFILEIRGRS